MTVQPTEAPAGSLVVFSLDERRYALALECVERSLLVVAVTPLPGAPALVLGVVDLSGEVIPVIDLRRRLGHPPRAVRLSDHLLVASTGLRKVALLVDETQGVLQAPPECRAPASGILPGLDLVEGAVKLESGLVLIHDLGRLLSLDEEAALGRALGGSREDLAGAAAGALGRSVATAPRDPLRGRP